MRLGFASWQEESIEECIFLRKRPLGSMVSVQGEIEDAVSPSAQALTFEIWHR
jgi:hypothetical protein